MSNIEKFLQDIKGQSGLKGRLKRLLFRGLLVGFEAADRDIKEYKEQFGDCCRRITDLENAVRVISKDNAELHSETNELKDRLDDLERSLEPRFNALDDAYSRLSEHTGAIRTDLENLSVNVRNNNSIIDTIRSDTELSKVKLRGIDRELKKLSAAAPAVTASSGNVPAETVKPSESAEQSSDYETIDYFDFENHFRGSIESIKNAQKSYLKYFSGKSNVLDIGCGRGEFLSLLKENNINAGGVDIYEPYVDYCTMNGLRAVCADGTEYLASLDKVDGIFVGQVVEHLEPHQIIRLCNTAYEKLEQGGCIVIETPNPTSLAIYTNAFYIDPSHVKPVHPLTMKYYLEKAGFKNIEIIYTENSRPPQSIPELKCSSAENADEFNAAMKTVSDIIFGSQDYAVAAVK